MVARRRGALSKQSGQSPGLLEGKKVGVGGELLCNLSIFLEEMIHKSLSESPARARGSSFKKLNFHIARIKKESVLFVVILINASW